MVKNRDGQTDPRRNPAPDEDGTAQPVGEDVVIGQFSVMPSGHTGTRRLVDQVPADIAPRGRGPMEPVTPDAPTAPSAERWADVPARSAGPTEVEEPEAPDPAVETREAIRRARDQFRQRSVEPARVEDRATDRTFDEDRRDRLRPRATPSPSADDAPRDRVRRPAERPVAREEISARGPDERPGMARRHGDDAADAGQPDDERARPMRRAPIPGPVPSGEVQRHGRREQVPGEVPFRSERPSLPRPGDRDPGGDGPSASAQHPALPDQEWSRSERPTPPRRRALPDLPDDFFTRGVIDPADPADRAASTSMVRHRPQQTSAPSDSGSAIAERPRMAEQAPTRPVMASDQDQRPSVQAGRPRPPVPRQPTEQGRPSPPPVRTIPTVAEVNEAYHSARGAQPARPADWSNGQPSNSFTGSGANRDQHLTPPEAPLRDEVVRDREPAVLEPPTPLRPETADFGDYGSWFDLQSVEPRLSPDLQRACATCRDFRPSENGARGWCANRDAFTLRTVVDASDLPCISSFGCWWVPYDAVWLSEAAVRDHWNPTPLLDQFAPQEPMSGSSRQHRRS